MTKAEKIDYYLGLLADEDEVTVLELLDVKSLELAERFQDNLADRLEYIENYFDEETGINSMMQIITGDQL